MIYIVEKKLIEEKRNLPMAQAVVINHIDEICKRKNITVKQLSIDSHIGERQLLRIRKGEAILSYADAYAISEAIGMPCAEIFEVKNDTT